MNPKKKPAFTVPNYGAKGRSRLSDRWRKQRGIDNKSRIKRKGYPKGPEIGYGAPKDLRFRKENGLYEVIIHNKNELLNLIGKNDYMAKFSSSLSKKKRIELQKIADEHNIKIANRVRI